ncbi:uncharacterized protein LOC144950138 [Lampetra fluviatilis]
MCHSSDDDDGDEGSEDEGALTPEGDPRCELITWEPPGIRGSEARDVLCVQPFYSDHVVCTWRPGPQAPPGVRYSLTYWPTMRSKWSEVREVEVREVSEVREGEVREAREGRAPS